MSDVNNPYNNFYHCLSCLQRYCGYTYNQLILQNNNYSHNYFLLTRDSSLPMKVIPIFSDPYSSLNNYDSDDDYSKPSFNPKITPIINSTSNNYNSTSSNSPNESENEFSKNSSYDEQLHDEFTEGYEQKAYEIGEYDKDYPKYNEDDLQEAIKYGCNIGIEETYDNSEKIQHDRR